MILLYYANYAVAAHGQWCILMAIVAQRGAIAIDQSCSGYANSSSTWRARSAEGGAMEGGWWKMMETRERMMTRTKQFCDINEIIILSFCHCNLLVRKYRQYWIKNAQNSCTSVTLMLNSGACHKFIVNLVLWNLTGQKAEYPIYLKRLKMILLKYYKLIF